MDKTLLIIESGSEKYRRYILEAAAAMKLHLVMVTNKDVRWEDALCERIIYADTQDWKDILQRLEEAMGTDCFDAILTYDEGSVLTTAYLAEKLGLPFIKPQVALAARNKYVMRSKFREHGLATPAFEVVKTVEELEAAVRRIGLPAVIKPTAGWASVGVVKLENTDSLSEIYKIVSNLKFADEETPSFVIEEYLSGNEVSVESVVYEGEVFHFGITQKFTGDEPYFEEIGHYFPAKLPEELQQEILEISTRGIRALGIDTGATHTELRLTSKGPIIIEIAARLGGDKIPYIADLAEGANMAGQVIRAALGQRPVVEKTRAKGAAIRFILPKTTGQLREFPNLKAVEAMPGIHEVYFKGKAGLMKLPPEGFFTRFGFIVAEADQAEEAYRLACAGEEALNIRLDR